MMLHLRNGTEEEEFGDLLFALVNISRFLKINPEFALTKAIKKFINRFEYVENSALSEGKQLSQMTLVLPALKRGALEAGIGIAAPV